MANRFWVGGTGNWTDTAHWSASSGGASGASAPTSADPAIFDVNSAAGAYVVTVNSASAVCASISFAAPPSGSITLTLNSPNILAISGALTLLAGMTLSGTGILRFSGSGSSNWTTNGVTVNVITQIPAGTAGTLVVQDAFNGGANSLQVQGGTLNTNGQTVTVGAFDSSNATVTLGTSVINISNRWACGSSVTLSAASSTINVAVDFQGGGKTYGTVVATAAAARVFSADGLACSFTNLSLLSTATRTAEWGLGANATVTGTFKYAGNSVLNRLLIKSSVIGTSRTITAAAIDGASDFCDFMDITAAGAASPFATGSSLGDGQGNTNITFTTPATQYWKTATTGAKTWSTAANWFLGSNGTGGAGRVPLPQDNVVFDANSIAAGSAGSTSITTDMPRSGKSITFVGVTSSPQVNLSQTSCFGDFDAGAATIANQQTFTFYGRGAQTLHPRGRQFGGIQIATYNGSLTLLGDLTVTAAGLTYFAPNVTFTLNNFNVTINNNTFNAQQTGGVLNLGSGTFTINTPGGGNAWVVQTTTINPHTGQIVINNSGGLPANFFQSAGLGTLNHVRVTGSGLGGINFQGGSLTFTTLTVDAGKTMIFLAGSTYTATTWAFNGAVMGAGTKQARVFGITNSYFSSPDSAANSITGDIDVRFKIALPAWGPGTAQSIYAKRSASSAFDLFLGGLTFNLIWRDAGNNFRTLAFDNISAGAAGSFREFRVTLDVDNGSGGHDCKLFEWNGSSWVQVGATKNAGAFTTSILDSVDPISVGGHSNGASSLLQGVIDYVSVRNGIDGPIVALFEPDDYVSGNTWVSSSPTGETWTRGSQGIICDSTQISVIQHAGTARAVFTKAGGGTVSIDGIAVSYNDADPASTFFAGRNSTDAGNNLDWTFGTTAAGAGSSSGVATTDGVGRMVAASAGSVNALASNVAAETNAIWNCVGNVSAMANLGAVGEILLNHVDGVGLAEGFATVSGMWMPTPKSRIFQIPSEGRSYLINGPVQ